MQPVYAFNRTSPQCIYLHYHITDYIYVNYINTYIIQKRKYDPNIHFPSMTF